MKSHYYAGVACASDGSCVLTQLEAGSSLCQIDVWTEEVFGLAAVPGVGIGVALIKNDTRIAVCQTDGSILLVQDANNKEEIVRGGSQNVESCHLAFDERGSAVLKRSHGTTVFYAAVSNTPVYSIDRSRQGKIVGKQEATDVKAVSIAFDAARGQLVAVSHSGKLYVAAPRVVGAATAAASHLDTGMGRVSALQWLGAGHHGLELDGAAHLEIKRRLLKDKFAGKVVAANATHLALLRLPGPRERHHFARILDTLLLADVVDIAVFASSLSSPVYIVALIEGGLRLAVLRTEPRLELDHIINLPKVCGSEVSSSHLDSRPSPSSTPSILPTQPYLNKIPTTSPTPAIIRDLDDDDVISFLTSDHAQHTKKPSFRPTATPSLLPTINTIVGKYQEKEFSSDEVMLSRQPANTKTPLVHAITFLIVLAVMVFVFALRRCQVHLSKRSKARHRRSGDYDRLSTSDLSLDDKYNNTAAAVTPSKQKQTRRPRAPPISPSIFSLSFWKRLVGNGRTGPYEPIAQHEDDAVSREEEEEEEDDETH